MLGRRTRVRRELVRKRAGGKPGRGGEAAVGAGAKPLPRKGRLVARAHVSHAPAPHTRAQRAGGGERRGLEWPRGGAGERRGRLARGGAGTARGGSERTRARAVRAKQATRELREGGRGEKPPKIIAGARSRTRRLSRPSPAQTLLAVPEPTSTATQSSPWAHSPLLRRVHPPRPSSPPPTKFQHRPAPSTRPVRRLAPLQHSFSTTRN